MPAFCSDCKLWTVKRRRIYQDGTEVVFYTAPEGKGHCNVLAVETRAAFSCIAFEPAAAESTHVVTELLNEPAWKLFKMGPCPDCNGLGSRDGACWRCAGTGNVRYYDDGHIGEERTRKHPIEIEMEKQAERAAQVEKARKLAAGEDVVEPEVIDPTVLRPMPKPNVF
jgi:hypothetical protein